MVFRKNKIDQISISKWQTNILFALILTVIVGYKPGNVYAADVDMKIEITPKADYLNVAIKNDGTHTLRVWEFTNSWGWSILSLSIKVPELDKHYRVIRRKTMGWTINFPSFTTIKPGGQSEIPIYPDSNWWEMEEELQELKDKRFQLKAILDIPVSPETKEFDIFVGRVESDWVISKPPHDWLFKKD